LQLNLTHHDRCSTEDCGDNVGHYGRFPNGQPAPSKAQREVIGTPFRDRYTFPPSDVNDKGEVEQGNAEN
jgi:hypothetical protein